MEHYAGIDVSLEQSSVCVVDATGRIVREAKVASEPEALVVLLRQLGLPLTRVGLEAGPLSQWLHAGLAEAGFEAVLLETRHVKAALSAMVVKTDRKDARGIAQLLRMGWYRPVHRKSLSAQEVRALLVGRKLLQAKLRDVELSIRGILRGFGLKVGEVSRVGSPPGSKSWPPATRCWERSSARCCRRAMACGPSSCACTGGCWPSCGRCGLPPADDGARRGGAGGGHLQDGGRRPGAVPHRQGGRRAFRAHAEAYQSGETDVTGGISKVGDAMVRTALYEAANVMLTRTSRASALKRWAMEVAKRRGAKRAKVALARKLAGVLHRMWADGTDFRWGKEETAA